MLKNCPLFIGLSTDELDDIQVHFGQTQQHRKGTSLPKDGRLGVVLKGSLCIRSTSADDRPLILNRLSAGEVYGVAQVFLPEHPLSLVTVEQDSTIFTMDQTAVLNLIRQNAVFGQNYLRFLAGRVEYLNKKISTFASYNTETRLFDYLDHEADEEGFVTFKSYSDLAKTLGVGRASLYRALDHLKKEGTLDANQANNKTLRLKRIWT